MNLVLKIFLSVMALLVLVAAMFYVWMWWAWTPNKTAPEMTHVYRTVKEGKFDEGNVDRGVTYRISARYKFSWMRLFTRSFLPLEEADSYSILITYPEFGPNHPIQTKITREIVQVKGRPIPVDLVMTKEGVVQVVFDGPLQNGSVMLAVGLIDDTNHTSGPNAITVANGIVEKDY